MSIICAKKGCEEQTEKELHWHHIIPKCFEGKDFAEKRKKIWLCKKHHEIYHNTLSCWLWKEIKRISFEPQQKVILNNIEKRSEEWLKKRW